MTADPIVYLFAGQVVVFAWLMVGLCRLSCSKARRR